MSHDVLYMEKPQRGKSSFKEKTWISHSFLSDKAYNGTNVNRIFHSINGKSLKSTSYTVPVNNFNIISKQNRNSI